MAKFTDRVAFVTGASRGIGKCIALELARAGCDVVVAAKSVRDRASLPGTIHDTAREIEALGRRALPVQLDVCEEDDVERGVRAALGTFGRVDFLVNNAGALFWRDMVDTPIKRFDRVHAVNVRGAYLCTQSLLPSMIDHGFGHILMISPAVDVGAAAGKIAYSISKFGMTMIAHGLAEELRGTGVACNALWPATMVESQATIHFGIGRAEQWRKPQIVADAVLGIFAKDPTTFSGHALIDEDFLSGEGVVDFSSYRCDPDHEPPRVGFDFKIDAGG